MKEKMKKYLNIFIILTFSVFFYQCSGTYKVKKDITKKGELTKTPKWYIKYDREDKNWMYETGSSVSPDLELAIKKSTLLAKSKLADRINGKMNNKSSILKEEDGLNENLSINAMSNDEITNIVGDTLVRKYIVENVEIFYTHYKSYRAYVKVKVSKENVDAVIKEIQSDKKVALNKNNNLKESIKEIIKND